MTREVLGIIPARGGSKSIPRKNLAELAGKPLIAHTFAAAKASASLTRVVVSTDDAEIAAYARSQGVEVPFLRPAELATDQAAILPVLRHLLQELEARDGYRPDAVALLQPTSPLRTAAHIDAAVERLFAIGADSVVTVVETPHQFNPASVMRLQDGLLTPFLPGEGSRILRRQDKPRVYARNGPAVLVSARRTLLELGSLYGEKCAALEMSAEDSQDIDTPFDLELAEWLMGGSTRPSEPRRSFMKTLIKKCLRGTGLYGPALKLRASFDPIARRINQDYREFRRLAGPIFAAHPIRSEAPRTLLLVGIHEFVPSAKMECMLARALEPKGFAPIVLMNKPLPAVERYYRLLGARRFAYLDDFRALISAPERARIEADLEQFFAGNPSFEAILHYKHGEYELGKHGLSWAVRTFHSGTPDFADPKLLALLKDTFRLGMLTALAAERMLDALRPDMAIFNERGYTPYGEIFDACLLRDINTIQYVGAHLNEALHFKRYTLATRSAHPISLDPVTWGEVKSMPLSAEQEEGFIASHYDNYRLGKWYERQKVQTGKALTSKEETYRLLNLDPARKTAVIFSQVLWDATFFYGEGIFKDYAEWLVETAKAACANPELNWVIKLHPANVWRLEADGYTGELVEHVLLREHIGKLPPHVVLLNPDTRINTFSLFQITDYCLTVRGTVGMEMPIFGIPVITAGTGRYSELGFSVNSASREEYAAKLSRLQDIPRLTPAQTRLARLHAYAVFKLRPLSFTAFKMEYPMDKSVPTFLKPLIGFGIASAEAFAASPDIRAFADWAVDRASMDFMS